MEFLPDYRKTVLALFSRKIDENFLRECGFLKDDKNRTCSDLEKFWMEQKEEYLEYNAKKKNQLLKQFGMNKGKLTLPQFLNILDIKDH